MANFRFGSLYRSLINFALKVSGAGLSFLLNVVIARTLDVNDAGVVFILVSMNTICFAVARFGLGYLTYRETAKYSALGDVLKVEKNTRAAIFICAFVSSIFCLTLIAMSREISTLILRDELHVYLLRVCLLIIPIYSVGSIMSEVLKGTRRSVEFAIFENVIIKATSIPLMYFFCFTFGIHGAGYALLLANFIGLIYVSLMLFGSQKSRKFQIIKHVDIFRDGFALLRRSPPFAIYSLGSVSLMWGGAICIGSTLGPSDAALFYAALRVASTVEFVGAAVVSVTGPELVFAAQNSDKSIFVKKLTRIILSAAAGTLFIAAPIIFFSKSILSLFGHEYANGSDVLILITVAYAFYSIFQVFAAAAIALNIEKRIGFVYLVMAPFSLLSIYLCSYNFGLKTAVLAFCISITIVSLFLLFVYYWFVRKNFRLVRT